MPTLGHRECLIPAFDSFHYVPLLYARSAEFTAASQLGPTQLGNVTPVWVIPPIATDPRTSERKKTRPQHIAAVAKSLLKYWGEQPAFADVTQYCATENDEPGVARATLDQLQDAGLNLVPVLRDRSPSHVQKEVAEFSADNDRDICLRLSSSVWADLGSATGDAAFAAALTATAADPSVVHLIIDVEDQISDPPNVSVAAVRGSMALLEYRDEWRSITLLGTSMPASTAEVGRDNAAELPRSEWAMWKALRDSRGRRSSYGDYGVQSVDALTSYNPLTMQTSAQLRYTVSNSWFVARGSSTRKSGFDQVYALARQIVNHSEFAGRDFSTGDLWIANCAVRATGTGNATTWRTATTNHHLAFVLSQLAILRGS